MGTELSRHSVRGLAKRFQRRRRDGRERVSRHRSDRRQLGVWEQAVKNAVETAGQSVRELRIAEVVRQDVTIEDGKVSGFRVRLGISFKYDK